MQHCKMRSFYCAGRNRRPLCNPTNKPRSCDEAASLLRKWESSDRDSGEVIYFKSLKYPVYDMCCACHVAAQTLEVPTKQTCFLSISSPPWATESYMDASHSAKVFNSFGHCSWEISPKWVGIHCRTMMSSFLIGAVFAFVAFVARLL